MKKIISILFLVFLIVLFFLLLYKKNNNEVLSVDKFEDINMLSMMLETEVESGKYKETTRSSRPSDGYKFNAELSKCENGSSLSWDNNKKSVVMNSNVSDKCYIYFDMARFDEVCDDKLLACHIAKKYTKTQGENNIYYHDKNLENGANDNSYRYAGSSESTNNFVCFGYETEDGSCPTDNLYRIIGVFDKQVKLIKSSDITKNDLGSLGDFVSYNTGHGGTYKGDTPSSSWYNWNKNNINEWKDSLLNTENLNNYYLNKLGKWGELISVTSWIVGGNTREKLEQSSMDIVYKNEILSPLNNTRYQAKIGLLYLSDYGYAALPRYWSYVGNKNNDSLHDYSESINDNWLYLGEGNWFITRCLDDNNFAFVMYYTGAFGVGALLDLNVVRPSFYLNSHVTYVAGNGTKNSPFIIK